MDLNLTAADIEADLRETPGMVAEARLDPLDIFYLEWLGGPA